MGDRYRPREGRDDGPPRMPGTVRDAMYHFTGNQDQRPARPAERRYRPRRNEYFRPPVSQRPLLTQKHDASDWQTFRDPRDQDKFRNPTDLTDSDEGEMVESEEEEIEMPVSKRVKANVAESLDTDALPKWSNPDPYTALPPPNETTGKRVDVVKLIRKAKISEAKGKEQDLADNDDFISFGEDLDSFVPEAPTEPRADRLGKRKRGEEDAAPRPPGGYRSRNDDSILREWQSSRQDESIPWHISCRPEDTASMALHKEIVDFYEWVRPKDYDIEVRSDVVKRLSFAFNRVEPGEVKSFGSFAVGMYLPVGDMDLVFLQRSFRPGVYGPNGLPEKPKHKIMQKFAKLLRDHQIARPGTVQVIGFAKVPIIKFVDDVSGLKIDLCFNNDTGVTAVETIEQWKVTYPALPILVALVKQFLMIRGLNDVSVGGLGGFSVICLVTSLIQHMPTVGITTDLGQLVVEFFNLYGNLMDYENVAIRLDPPGYIDKASYKPHLFSREKRERLTIIDPNRPENNVSGGSHLIEQILEAFSSAHNTLQATLAAFTDDTVDMTSFSFLKDLVGGNFDSYTTQRKALQGLYFGLTGQEASEPPVRPASQVRKPLMKQKVVPQYVANGVGHGRSAGQEAHSISEESMNGSAETSQTKLSKSGRRAARLKLARPDIASQVGDEISMPAAVKLGGYKNAGLMDKVLTAAEVEHQKRQKQNS